ncbi:MAG: hypothetical protein COA36_17755 [Desulfotalea sp.]|nr:MAG: hypothetical protein COA36_17755 [Desulfotalea sp.]
MDPITLSIFMEFSSGILANFATDAVKHFFISTISVKPELENKIKAAKTSTDIEAIFKEAVGVIDAYADQGNITIDGGLLKALRGIRFDHAHGTVNIAGTTIKSEVLVTGGSAGSSGKTVIGGNTSMKSQGTSIERGEGCSITMTGGANITQT